MNCMQESLILLIRISEQPMYREKAMPPLKNYMFLNRIFWLALKLETH